MYELIVEAEFSAAHRLREYHGACENLHGHNYRVEMVVAGKKLDKSGLLVDFRVLKDTLRKATARFDHVFLNELAEFLKQNPSAENLARTLFEECARGMPRGVEVRSVTVWESPRCGARYSPSQRRRGSDARREGAHPVAPRRAAETRRREETD